MFKHKISVNSSIQPNDFINIFKNLSSCRENIIINNVHKLKITHKVIELNIYEHSHALFINEAIEHLQKLFFDGVFANTKKIKMPFKTLSNLIAEHNYLMYCDELLSIVVDSQYVFDNTNRIYLSHQNDLSVKKICFACIPKLKYVTLKKNNDCMQSLVRHHQSTYHHLTNTSFINLPNLKKITIGVGDDDESLRKLFLFKPKILSYQNCRNLTNICVSNAIDYKIVNKKMFVNNIYNVACDSSITHDYNKKIVNVLHKHKILNKNKINVVFTQNNIYDDPQMAIQKIGLILLSINKIINCVTIKYGTIGVSKYFLSLCKYFDNVKFMHCCFDFDDTIDCLRNINIGSQNTTNKTLIINESHINNKIDSLNNKNFTNIKNNISCVLSSTRDVLHSNFKYFEFINNRYGIRDSYSDEYNDYYATLCVIPKYSKLDNFKFDM